MEDKIVISLPTAIALGGVIVTISTAWAITMFKQVAAAKERRALQKQLHVVHKLGESHDRWIRDTIAMSRAHGGKSATLGKSSDLELGHGRFTPDSLPVVGDP